MAIGYLETHQLSIFSSSTGRHKQILIEKQRDDYPELASLADEALANYGHSFVKDFAEVVTSKYIDVNFIEPSMVVAAYINNFNEATMLSLLQVHELNYKHLEDAIELCISRLKLSTSED